MEPTGEGSSPVPSNWILPINKKSQCQRDKPRAKARSRAKARAKPRAKARAKARSRAESENGSGTHLGSRVQDPWGPRLKTGVLGPGPQLGPGP